MHSIAHERRIIVAARPNDRRATTGGQEIGAVCAGGVELGEAGTDLVFIKDHMFNNFAGRCLYHNAVMATAPKLVGKVIRPEPAFAA